MHAFSSIYDQNDDTKDFISTEDLFPSLTCAHKQGIRPGVRTTFFTPTSFNFFTPIFFTKIFAFFTPIFLYQKFCFFTPTPAKTLSKTFYSQLFITVSLLSITTIAVDRMCGITCALGSRASNMWRYPAMLAFVWIAALCLTLLPIYYLTDFDEDGYCSFTWTTKTKDQCLEFVLRRRFCLGNVLRVIFSFVFSEIRVYREV